MLTKKHNRFLSTTLASLFTSILLLSSNAAMSAESTQRDILQALYNDTNGAAWTNNTDWLGAAGTECSWAGVECNTDGKVIGLSLKQNNLVGSIPNEVVGLSFIQYLDLGGNQLSGTIPENLSQLTNLNRIWLWGNQFEGSLPTSFGGMTQLTHLSLGGNKLSGSIPVSYGNLVNLLNLDLAYNQLSGTIPSELGNLVNATAINLRDNQLSGAVPAPVLALGTVNLWANPNLTGIAFGDPAACDNQTPLTLGAQVAGELTPFEDCYFDDERIMADFYRLDLSGESGTTLFKIDAYSDHYYPHVGVLDANGNDGQDIVETQIQQNGLSFEVALVPGEYVLYIHGGSYQPQNVAATGTYTLSTTVINQSQIDCVAPTWVTKGVALDAALSSDDCLDTYNDPDRLYDSYKIWLEQGESVIVALTADFESQLSHFIGNQFGSATPNTLGGQQQVHTFTATSSGWQRYAVYTSNNNPLAEGNYNIQFFEPPVFGDAQACTEGLPTLALGGSTSGAALDRDTDCYIAGRMSDRYALSLDSDTLFRATMDADGFTPLLSIYNAGAAEPITLNGNSQSNFTAEFYLAAGEYWLAASSGASNGLAPIEGSYELSLTASLPISQLQDSCMVTTTVFAGASLAGEVNTNDCRNGFVADVEARPYFDGYEFTVGAGELVYPALTVDFPVKLAHWFNGAFQQQYLLGAGEDVRISINTAGTHELYVLGQSVNDLGSYQLDLFQSQPDLETIPIAFSFAFTDFRNVVDGVVQTGPSDHVLTGIVDAVMADDDVFEVISLREVALDGNAYVLGDEPGIVAMRANQPALLSLSGNLLDVLVCPGGFGATNDCPFGEEGGFLISEFWSPVAQGGALAGHPALGAAYRDRSIPLNKAGWSANLVTESASQRDILVDLYNSTGGDNWTDNTNWLGAEGTECSWYGVQCDGDENVTQLSLERNNLVGSIPAEIGDLSTLQLLLMGGNQLSGTIPSSIAQLDNLTNLQLWNNQYNGALPSFISEMTQLQYLGLGGNQFSGTIPASYGNLVNMRDLQLSYTQLSGSIPEELANLVNATTINLSNNQLSGPVPDSVLSLGVVNLWANPNLTGIEFGNPVACENQAPLALGAQIEGALTPFEDCYIEEERIMADFFRLDLSGESGTTLFKIEAYSDFYYPHVGVLDASGVEGQDIVDTQIQQNGLSFEVALVPGEYVLYIHGGSYQPRNVAATGAYTLSTTVIGQAQVDCVAPTWVNKGIELDAALSSDDCLDTYNDPDRLYDSYNIWLEEGESLITTLTADFESQILHFAGNDFISSTPSTAAGQQQVLTYSAPYSGWHRYAVYASNNTPLAEGDYTIAFFEPPVFGSAQACTEGLPTLALGGSTSGAALDRDTDCYIAGRMSDRYSLSLDSDTLFRATMDADGYTPLLSIYKAGAAEPITLNGNSQSNFTAEFYLAAGEYWLAASSGASNGLAPIEGSYELSLTASLPISQLQDSCMVTTTVFAGASLAGEVNTNDCRNGFVADVEARPYFDGYEFTVGAGELVYPALTVDFPVKLAHWFNGAFQQQYLLGAGEDVRISINTAGTHELYVLGQSVNDLGSYQLDLFQSQPDLETIPIAFSFAFTDFRNVVDGVVQTGPSDHVLTGIVDAVMADDDVFEVISLREVALDGNAYVLGDEPGIVAMRANQPALLSLSGNLLDVLVCPGGFGATNDCPFGEEGGFLISEFWSPVAQGGALAGHPALGAAYRDRSIPLNKAGWSANLVTESASQRDILVDLYNSTGGDNWTDNTNWLGAEGTECSWYGVQCDGDSNVTHLNLDRNNLVGNIPSEIGSLSSLQQVFMGGNQLSGTIPSSIAQLENLNGIWLWGNQFNGSLPAFFSQMTQLRNLALGSNQFSGSIPESYGDLVNLVELNLAYNQLSGSIPASLGNLVNANAINLRDNQLSGAVPAQVQNLGTVNVWANPNLTGIAFGSPAACDTQTPLALGAAVDGELTPFEDCYFDDERVMADFYRLDLSAESGTTLFRIDAHSDHFYPHVGVLDANGNDGQDIVDTRIQQNGLSFEVALPPGEYVLYIHGGSYQPQNVAATGAYTLSTQSLNELQSGCLDFSNTWVTKGVAVDAALSGDDCVDTYNNLNRLYDDYTIWLEQGESIRIDAQSQFNSQILAFNEAGFVNGSFNGAPNVPYSTRFTALQTGWYRVAMYNALGSDGATGAYSISFSDAPAFSADERAALVALYNATDGANWTNKNGWLGDTGTECSWFGVSCDGYGVIGINLIGNGLVGTIPSELSQLSELRTLHLSTNQLTGNIPAQLGQLSKLNTLSLYTNQLTGSIPVEFSQLSALRSLSLFGNQLSGSIPAELGQLSELTFIGLQQNQLSGSIPSELGELDKLVTLGLFMNQLTGSIPTELGQLENLKQLYLFNNQLTGSIPTSLGQLSNLTTLYLQQNQLSGTIPSELGQLSNLLQLYLFENQFDGSIPAALGQLSKLTHLGLRENQLSGAIPVELGQLSNLTALILSDNLLTGSIPTELGNLSKLQSLYIAGNQLSGSVPTALTQLNDLTTLDLSNNNLTGLLPTFSQSVAVNVDGNSISNGSVELGADEKEALVALYNATGGDNWTNNTGWLGAEGTECSWFGVICDDSGVVEINLLDNGLAGTIPTELSQLSALESLKLGRNQLTGNIPVELGQLSNLIRLHLFTNQLSGPIPVELSQLSNLLELFLGGNQLSGSIPAELAQLSNLSGLVLYSNQLSGSIPTELGALSNLKVLYLFNNQLTGSIPTSLGQLSNLTQLNLDRNQLSGPIPESLGQLSNLEQLTLQQNQLSGSIPEALTTLNELTILNLSNNNFTGYVPEFSEAVALTVDGNNFFSNSTVLSANEKSALIALYNATGGANWTNKSGWLGAEGTECSWFGVICDSTGVVEINLIGNGLTGTVPSSVSQLVELKSLRLYNNQLTGSIPSELGQLSKLTRLYLYNNQLSGAIPTELGQLTNLGSLGLNQNQLSGPIPASLGQLSNLVELHLQQNQLSGNIPVELGQLSNLTRLSVHQNQLTGAIPSELGQLSNLTHLYLHQNELSGSIPSSLGQLGNLVQLFVHENQLTGSIPSSLGQLSNMTHLVLSFNLLSGEIPTEFGQLSSLLKLFARDNLLTGSIPAELAQASSLTELHLAGNQLSGSIPTALTQLANLVILDLLNNNLTGSLPAFDQSVVVTVDLPPPPEETPTPTAPPAVTDQLADINGDIDAIEAIEIIEGQVVSDEVVNQVGNALDKTNALAQQVTETLPEGQAGVGVALTALDSMSRTLTASAKVSSGGGAVSNTAATNSINSVATVLNALSTRTESITPQQRATVQALASTTVSNSSNLIRAGATNDELVSMVAATSAVINAASAAGGELTTELVAQAEALVTKAVKTGMSSFAPGVDVEDPVQLGNLLRTNPDALQFAIDASVAVKSRIKPDAAAVDQELASRGIEGAASANLTSVLNAVSNPDGISVGGSSASEVLLSALVQFLTGGTQALTTDGGLQTLALSTGGIDLAIDSLTGTVIITAPGEKYSAAIANTKIVSASVPEGLSFMRDGRALIVANGVAMELAPIALDLIGFTNAVEKAGFNMTLRDGGLVDISISANERFVGVFAFDNISNSTGSCGATTIVEPTGALNAPSYAFELNCVNGVQQRIVPFVHDVVFYRSVAAFGHTMTTDRNTGIVTISATGKYKPSFFVNKLTESEQAFLAENKDARGSAFKEIDLNGDGLADIVFYTAAGAQVLYKVAQ